MWNPFKKKTPKSLVIIPNSLGIYVDISSICGYKDKKGKFFETAELAHASNISNEKDALRNKLEALLDAEYSYYPYAIASKMFDNSDKIRVALDEINEFKKKYSK